MSNLVTFITTLAGMSVSDGTNTPSCLYHSTLKAPVFEGDCPVRLILPADDDNANDFDFIALGQANAITWQLADLLLIAPAGDQFGWAEHALAIDTYCGDYATALVALRTTFGNLNANIVNLSMRRGTYTYGGTEYFGVKIIVTIQEFA